MSSTYIAGVFFGAFVERDSPLGKKLDRYIDEAGGTTAKTEVPGVEVCLAGSHSTGDLWMVVRAKGSPQEFSREDNVTAPVRLTENTAWGPVIAEFFERLKVHNPPTVGWHFAGTVL